MNFGINPYWGSYLNDRLVGDWTNFAVNQGFNILEFTINSRAVDKGLSVVLDRKVLSTLTSARKRGLKLHVVLEPHFSGLGSHRISVREEAIKRFYLSLRFLENNLHAGFVLLHPGKAVSEKSPALDGLIESFRRLQEQFPSLRLGLKVGEESNYLRTPREITQLISRIRGINLALDIGWAFLNYGDNWPEVSKLLQAMKNNLYEVHWRNIIYKPLQRRLPLSKGYLRESHYLKIFSLFFPREDIRHILDYRDQSRKQYRADKLTLEEIHFRSRRI